MTVTLELTAEQEAGLHEEAQRRGVPIAQVVGAVLDEWRQRASGQAINSATHEGTVHNGANGGVADNAEGGLSDVAIAARVAAVRAIGNYDTRQAAGLAPLSDADIARETIYGERGL